MDASPVGLGAMLTQDGKVITYASKALSSVERRYSQIECEALAIAWGCHHFQMYLLKSHFKVKTDHKPLLPIFNKLQQELTIALMHDDVTISLVTSKRGLVVMLSREY